MKNKILFISSISLLFIFSANAKGKPDKVTNNYYTTNNYTTSNYSTSNVNKVYNESKNGYIAELNFRIADTQKTTTEIFGGYDFNNSSNYCGIRFTIKIGKSYEEKIIENLKRRLKW